MRNSVVGGFQEQISQASATDPVRGSEVPFPEPLIWALWKTTLLLQEFPSLTAIPSSQRHAGVLRNTFGNLGMHLPFLTWRPGDASGNNNLTYLQSVQPTLFYKYLCKSIDLTYLLFIPDPFSSSARRNSWYWGAQSIIKPSAGFFYELEITGAITFKRALKF